MKVDNIHPYPFMYFPNISPDGTSFTTFLMKGTFEIDTKNEILIESKEQSPIEVSDRFRGDPAWTSLEYESDLAPFKPATDICVIGKAYSPKGLPAKSWLCGIEVGALKKSVRVTGPRFWKKEENESWSLTDPDPCTEVELSFENAYGGGFQTEDGPITYEENPSGKGFIHVDHQDEITTLPAPQIEDVDEPIAAFDEQYAPQSFFPVAKAWLPRRDRAGTYDEKWRKNKYPNLPNDFDYRFYNCASEGMVYPGFLKGNEHIILEHMNPKKENIQFQLPEKYFLTECRRADGEIEHPLMALDTLFIDTEKYMVLILWRGVTQGSPEEIERSQINQLHVK